MSEEEKKLNETGEVADNTDYIAAIKELKEKSVDRQKYEQLKAENKKLLEAVVNGQEVNVQPENKMRDVDEIRKELFNSEKDLNNLEYITLSLELRDALIAKGEPDPFIPVGKQIAPTRDDVEAAERVATVFKECVEYADGDSEIFTNELQRRTKDVKIRK